MVDDIIVKSQRKAPTRWLMAGAVMLVMGALIVYGLRTQTPLEGRQAPDLSLDLLDGGRIALKELRGRVVVINFWASWCAPCRTEAPTLERVWREYQGEDVMFVGISFKDVDKAARAFVQDFGITYANGVDSRGAIAKAYGVHAVPETFFVTRDGRIRLRHIGPIQEDKLRAVLDELLAP